MLQEELQELPGADERAQARQEAAGGAQGYSRRCPWGRGHRWDPGVRRDRGHRGSRERQRCQERPARGTGGREEAAQPFLPRPGGTRGTLTVAPLAPGWPSAPGLPCGEKEEEEGHGGAGRTRGQRTGSPRTSLTAGPAAPAGPGGPGSPRAPWGPSLPRAPWGPVSPWGGRGGGGRAVSARADSICSSFPCRHSRERCPAHGWRCPHVSPCPRQCQPAALRPRSPFPAQSSPTPLSQRPPVPPSPAESGRPYLSTNGTGESGGTSGTSGTLNGREGASQRGDPTPHLARTGSPGSRALAPHQDSPSGGAGTGSPSGEAAGGWRGSGVLTGGPAAPGAPSLPRAPWGRGDTVSDAHGWDR